MIKFPEDTDSTSSDSPPVLATLASGVVPPDDAVTGQNLTSEDLRTIIAPERHRRRWVGAMMLLLAVAVVVRALRFNVLALIAAVLAAFMGWGLYAGNRAFADAERTGQAEDVRKGFDGLGRYFLFSGISSLLILIMLPLAAVVLLLALALHHA